jgi:hypothetical protein
LQLTQPTQAVFYSGAAASPREPLQHHPAIGDLATHQLSGQGKPALLRQLRLTASPMAIASLQGLKAPQALPTTREAGNRYASPQACTDQLGGELHLAHHQNLIQQGQPHAIKLLLIASHHQLLALDAGGPVGAEQVQGAHTAVGR